MRIGHGAIEESESLGYSAQPRNTRTLTSEPDNGTLVKHEKV
jgi:hypothetical protein